jgi:hypothetical protein
LVVVAGGIEVLPRRCSVTVTGLLIADSALPDTARPISGVIASDAATMRSNFMVFLQCVESPENERRLSRNSGDLSTIARADSPKGKPRALELQDETDGSKRAATADADYSF